MSCVTPARSDRVDAETPRGNAPLARTLELARPAWGRLTLATLLGAGALAAAIGLIATSAWLISRASQRPQESALALAIVAVQFFGLSRGLFRYGERLVGHDAAFRVLAGLRVGVYRRLESLAPAGLPAFRSGDLLARIVDDVDSLQELLLRVIPPFAAGGLVGALTVTLVWWLLPAAGLILLSALLLAATAVPWLAGRLARRREARHAAARGAMAAAVLDLVEGAPELAVNGALERQLARVCSAEGELERIERSTAGTTGSGQGLTALLSGLAMWGALLVGVSAVHSGAMAGVLLAVIALTPLAAFEIVAALPTAVQTLERVRGSAARVFAVCDTPAPLVESTAPFPVPAAPHLLCVRGLRARYAHDGPWALDGIDLDLAPGRRVALVGPSGAGKSTLAAVLLRFLAYQDGSVTLSGVALEDLDGDAYRRVTGLAAQDAHIFDSTIEENLRLARRGASESELCGALQEVQLLDWAQALPRGLATEVGEHGARISGGQRQRLALARAQLADFPILVLDEPAEHVDAAMGEEIVGELLASRERGATLLITHRLSGLDAADEVIVLEGGRVLERGTHAELVAREGRYAKMWWRERGVAGEG